MSQHHFKKRAAAAFLLAALSGPVWADGAYQPKDSYQYGWQGAGNYIDRQQMNRLVSDAKSYDLNTAAGMKAACTVELAAHTYREVNTKGVTEFLAAQAMRYAAMGKEDPGMMPALPSTPRLYPERRLAIQGLKADQCSAPKAHCAEVMLAGAEYEMKENYPRHAEEFLEKADRLIQEAKAETCPVPAVKNVPPALKNISLSADTLFAFGSARLSENGKADLNRLAGQVRAENVRLQSVNIEGHSDRIGPDASNMRLSEQRARAVANYLTANHPEWMEARINVIGYGESRPVKMCGGATSLPALKSCLQPNRRVEVKITGIH